MADRFQLLHANRIAPISESQQSRRERLQAAQNLSLQIKKEKVETRSVQRKGLILRALQFEETYQKKQEAATRLKRKAKSEGGFYVESTPKVVFAIRIRGINKMPPKPKMILRLFRLRQIHNGVFIKLNKSTQQMLRLINPYIVYGYPSLKTIRQLVYKRGYGSVGKLGAKSRVRLSSNSIVANRLGKYGMYGVEDVIREIYTGGRYFKQASNFLWPFKLSSPRKGYIAKRRGFSELAGGDYGNRETLINELVGRMN